MSKAFQRLSVRDLRVVRQGKLLLGPVTVDITSPGVTVVLGHNGAGKSLFLKACHGQFPINSGEIRWNDEPARETRQTRSFMFQGSPILRRSVWANVEYALTVQGVPKAQRQPRVGEALDMVRLSDKAHHPAASLSGGERQRLNMARAWVIRPRCVILDEPAASLDPASTKELEQLIRTIAEEGVKVIMASHDLSQAKRLANEVLMFAQGKLIAQEPAESFFTRTHDDPIAAYLEGRL